MTEILTEADFRNMASEPDFSAWNLESIRNFWQYVRENGGYSAVMSDLVWGTDKEFVGKKYAQILSLPIGDMEPAHEEVYGKSPRRISCETSLAKTAGTPFLWCHVVNAPIPERNQSIEIDGRRLVHVAEKEKTLYEGAWQISEFTWISMPARALLDVAHYRCFSRTPEWLIWAVRVSSFPSEEIIELAELLDMKDAVRKICSIAYLLDKQETDNKLWLSEIKDYSYTIDQEPIWLDTMAQQEKIYWTDESFGVLWNISPEILRTCCYGPKRRNN